MNKKILILAPRIDEFFKELILIFNSKIEFVAYSIEFLKELKERLATHLGAGTS